MVTGVAVLKLFILLLPSSSAIFLNVMSILRSSETTASAGSMVTWIAGSLIVLALGWTSAGSTTVKSPKSPFMVMLLM